MRALNLVPESGRPEDPESAIREFIAAEAAKLTAPTAARYGVVAETLFDFLDTVDVRHRLGPEIARHLGDERQRLGSGAFLPTLGVASLVRMLPDFLDDPWLPPQGAQRRSHRVVVERLLVFLRRRGLVDSAVLRDDFKRARSAIRTAQSRDYGWRTVGEEVAAAEVVEVTLGLRSEVLDPLLREIERGDFTSLTDAIDARLDSDRRYSDEPYPHGW